MGPYYIVLQTFVEVMVIYYIVRWMYRKQIFLKA